MDTPDSSPSQPAADSHLLRVSQLVLAAVRDLGRRLNTELQDIALLQVETHIWPDSSLGCPVPGEIYVQRLTPGLILRFHCQEQDHTYHTSWQGPPFCTDSPRPAVWSEDDPVIAGAMLDLAQRLQASFSAIDFVQAQLEETSQSQPHRAAPCLIALLQHEARTFRYAGPPQGPLMLQAPGKRGTETAGL